MSLSVMWKLYGGLKLKPKHLTYYLKKQSARKKILQLMPKQSVCAEIGVLVGAFSKQILKHTSPTELNLIDPWEFNPNSTNAVFGHSQLSQSDLDRWHRQVSNLFASQIDSHQIVLHRQKSHTACTSFPDEYFDWVYIDGDHTYKGVKRDLEDYHPKIKPGGYIILDDYNVGGPWQQGVRQAADEFVSQFGLNHRRYFNQLVIQIPS